MAAILRGDIRWADLAPTKGAEQAGRRPVVILSDDIFNKRSGTVIAMAITSQEPRVGFPLALELTACPFAKKVLGKDQSRFALSLFSVWEQSSVAPATMN